MGNTGKSYYQETLVATKVSVTLQIMLMFKITPSCYTRILNFFFPGFLSPYSNS
jgi:hypothetical protein